MRHYFLAAALYASVFTGSAVSARGESLVNIPLTWSPTSNLAEMGPLDVSGTMITTTIHFDGLTDVRQNPSLVAENREDDSKVRTVTTSGNVASFVADHLKESLSGAGMVIVDGNADVTISGEIRQFFVTEMSTYKGEISILVHVRNGAGKELWTGVVQGDSTRWGRSYSAANYYETLSDMLLRATYNLLSNPGFRAALAQR